MTNKLKFSSERAEKNFEFMKLATKQLAVEMHIWAFDQGVHLTFTETWTTPTEDRLLKRASDTHRTGRAFDIRTRDLTPEFIEKFITYFMTKYNKTMGAVNSQGPCLIVYKPHGTGPHFHVQIKRNYDKERISGEDRSGTELGPKET